MVDESAYGDFALKRFLRMEIEGTERGRARARVTIEDRHLNPNGVVHGAVLFAMVDTAMGKAMMSVLPEGQFCASVDIQLQFIRPVSQGGLVADAVVLKQGRGVAHLDARVNDTAQRLIAIAAGTFAVIAP
jgi:acyl-CoA thioesterase